MNKQHFFKSETFKKLEIMARQDGVIKINGTIGDITFYKSGDGYLARLKGGVPGTRIATDIDARY